MAGNSKVSSSEKGKALKVFKVGRKPSRDDDAQHRPNKR
jgi:hypothetical protein